MANKTAIFFTALLFIVVCVTSYFAFYPRENSIAQNLVNIPEKTASDIEIRQMDVDGRLSYHFIAQSATQFGEDLYNLKNISGALFNGSGPPWTMSADKGKITDRTNKMKLWGNVIAKRSAYEKVPALEFDTNSLTVYIKQRYAETEDPVKFLQPGSGNSMSGVGMHTSLNKQTLDILSKVDSYYVPIKTTP